MQDPQKALAKLLIDALHHDWPDEAKGRGMRLMVDAMKGQVSFMLHDVREFHEKFKLGYDGGPRQLDEETKYFRVNFMQEELDEYVEAYDKKDLEGQLDALVDLAYVLLGTAYLQGFTGFGEAWRRVHRANMRKVRAERPEDSKRGSGFDVVKPPGWEASCLTDLVQPELPFQSKAKDMGASKR